MGKYDENKKDWVSQNSAPSEWNLKLYIANELAEANRLKRLELSHNWPNIKGHVRKELEDKA